VSTESTALLAVCGAHLQGQPLHPVLLQLGAVLVEVTRTAPLYTMVLLSEGAVPRPGLIRCRSGGSALEVEVYRIAVAALGPLLVTVTSPLAIGSVVLASGEQVLGFVCEGFAGAESVDLTQFGSWRKYLAHEVIPEAALKGAVPLG
jgi:allophanate hydrolase